MSERAVPPAHAHPLRGRAWPRMQENKISISYFTPMGNSTLIGRNLSTRAAAQTILIVLSRKCLGDSTYLAVIRRQYLPVPKYRWLFRNPSHTVPRGVPPLGKIG